MKRQPTVLVVDDEAEIVELMGDFLDVYGFWIRLTPPKYQSAASGWQRPYVEL